MRTSSNERESELSDINPDMANDAAGSGAAGDNVLRMAPPLIIGETEMREAMETLRIVFKEMSA